MFFKSPIARAIPFWNTLGKSQPINKKNVQQAIEETLIPTPNVVPTTLNGTTTLTAASSLCQQFTGTASGHSLFLPNATTLTDGWIYEIWNFSSTILLIKDAGGNVLTSLRANSHTVVLLRSNATANGTWALTYTLDNGNAFGTELQYVEDNTETNTASQVTWKNKLTLTTPASLNLGDYLLNFQFIWRSANANRNINVRLQKGGSDIENWQPFMSNVTENPLVAGFSRIPAISGSNTMTLDFRVGTASSTTVYMSKARIFLWRIA